jgi:hypothetical protein
MPLVIPESLLALLRERRAATRARRAAPDAEPREQRPAPRTFMDTVDRLFSRGAAPEQAAGDYVGAMDTWQDEVEARYDAFLLDPGMGPMTYLTTDGRVLLDMRGWDGDGIVEAEGHDVNAALLVGAKKTGIAQLLELIPKAPPGSRTCPVCAGKRLAPFGPKLEFPCRECSARGWIGPSGAQS